MENNSIIKERLKRLREEKGIYQKDLADKLHITRATIASYETGKSLPSLDVVLKYADFFECTTDYILGRTNERNLTITKDKDIEIIHNKDTVVQEAAISLLKETLNRMMKEEE